MRKDGMRAGPTFDRKRWQRVVPAVSKRSWYTVNEAANILIERGIIHKTSAKNKHGEAEICGVQQVRKYIRKGELAATLYENSKKYGYIIDKEEVERFCKVKKEELKKRYETYLKTLMDEEV